MTEQDVSYRNYGGITLHGEDSRDKVCVGDSCISNFDFFFANKDNQRKLPRDGVMGLSRDINVDGIVAGPLIVKALKAVG